MKMGKGGINRAAKNFNVNFLEFFNAIGEGDDFSGADEGPVQGVEEEDNVPGNKRLRDKEREEGGLIMSKRARSDRMT